MNETIARALRQILIEYAQSVKNDPNSTAADIVAASIGFPYYKQEGNYSPGDVRRDPETEQPYRCLLAYDASVQPDWNLTTPTLWAPYHGISKETAYPWKAPTGAHDMYKAGEYVTYTDGTIYKCLQDTAYSPEDYPSAWQEQ